MIKQGIVNDSILEKKFKILRTSIMLGNVKNMDEVLSTYEETAKELDDIRRGVYEELLASKMYTTTTLEEERDRLNSLIGLTESRVKERNDFIDDYIKVTSNFLDNLPRVSNEDELPQYKVRLDNINTYLNNCEEIKKLNDLLKEKRKELEDKYESKAGNEVINAKLENELIDEFNKAISVNDYYSGLNYTDLDAELATIENSLSDKKDVMNTFISSYEALKNAGISGSEKDEYLSYVKEAKKDYYSELEKKYMLSIYKLVLAKETDYEALYQKRLYIDNILKDRLKSRVDLEITSRDDLEYFASVCNEQFSIIKSQKVNMENIERLIIEIAEIESKLEELDNENSKVEVLDLLNEFSVQKQEIEKIDMPDEKEIHDEVMVNIELGKPEPKPNNMVVRITDPIKINVKNATDTAKLVMKKVVIVLEPKRFNNKRDKLKEAEKELEELKQKSENKKEPIIQVVNRESEEVSDEGSSGDTSLAIGSEVSVNENNIFPEEKSDVFSTDDTFVTLDASNTTGDTYDDVFVSEDLNINLDTQESENAKNTYTTDSVKLNVPSSDVTLPTEIFIEEPEKKKQPDLFSQTDPFLDDNKLEIEDSAGREEIVSNMPKIGSFGSVKPTSMLSKIEEAANENSDIVLPTMGLTNNNKTNVPIVSENYIN